MSGTECLVPAETILAAGSAPLALALDAFQPQLWLPRQGSKTRNTPTTMVEPHRGDLREGGVNVEADFFNLRLSSGQCPKPHCRLSESALAGTWPARNEALTFAETSRASPPQVQANLHESSPSPKGCCRWRRDRGVPGPCPITLSEIFKKGGNCAKFGSGLVPKAGRHVGMRADEAIARVQCTWRWSRTQEHEGDVTDDHFEGTTRNFVCRKK